MDFLKSKTLVFLAVIFVLGTFLRFYHLEQSPPGFYVDEAAIGYNAYSILKTGKDEYGKTFPIFFRSFGDYKMPLYIYLSVLPTALFGLSVFSARFISALCGSLSLLLVYFLVRELFPKKADRLGLLVTAGLAFSPLPVFFSRMALEVSLALFCLLLALFLQLKSFAKKSDGLLVLSVLAYALSAYTYHTERFLAPVIFFSVSLILFWHSRSIGKKYWLKMIISCLLLAVLLFPQIRLFNSAAGQARLKSLGSQEGTFKNYLSQYLAYFSPRNLFFNPDPDRQRSFPELSVFYPWMCLPFLLGLYLLFKRRGEGVGKSITILLLILSPLPASLARDPFSSFRAYPLVFPLILVIAFGLEAIYDRFRQKMAFFILGFIVILASLADLSRNAFVLLPQERFNDWSYGYSSLAEKLPGGSYGKVLIDDPIGTSYIEVLFFLRYPPAKFQEEQLPVDLKNYYQIQNWPGTFAWDKFAVRTIIWRKDIYADQLIVAKPLAISESQAKEHFLTKAFAIIGPDGKIIFNGYLTHPDLKRKDDESRNF